VSERHAKWARLGGQNLDGKDLDRPDLDREHLDGKACRNSGGLDRARLRSGRRHEEV